MARRLVAAIFAVVAVLFVVAPPAGAFGPARAITIFPNCGPNSYYKLVTATGRETPLSPMDGIFRVSIQLFDPIAEIQPPAAIIAVPTYGDSYISSYYIWVYPAPGIHFGAGRTPPLQSEIDPRGSVSKIIVQASPAAPPITQDIWIPSSSGCNKP